MMRSFLLMILLWTLALSCAYHLMTTSIGAGVSRRGSITMRKQKASDRRTRRMQRGDVLSVPSSSFIRTGGDSNLDSNLVSSPLNGNEWKHKRVKNTIGGQVRKSGGRGRALKRSYTYAALSAYHSIFGNLLTEEFRAEEMEVIERIEASRHNPLTLEDSGQALFDMYPQRRGNIFAEEVYRLLKAKDASTSHKDGQRLPSNNQFSRNDVIILTRQPKGSGDIFGVVPTDRSATTCEARVINTGPTYVDIAIPSGTFEAAFGPAPNDRNKKGDAGMRLRIDRFFSSIPYNRMLSAIGQVTSLPEKIVPPKKETMDSTPKRPSLDPVLKEVIVSTYGYGDDSYPSPDVDLNALSKKLAKPPLKASVRLASEVMSFISMNPRRMFSPYNPPQLTAINAALTRRFTMIQGPPGTGKTTVAAAIAFGFAHQAKSTSANARVLACAFSNVGADQLALSLIKVGLKVVRVGKPSSVTQDLWKYTLDAAVNADPDAQRALEAASKATAKLGNGKLRGSEKNAATDAVKASILARKVASTRALRDCDVIVSTSVGAGDAQLLSACGIVTPDEENEGDITSAEKSSTSILKRDTAPDGLPPLTLPFTIIDEACQSVEPASLIPIVSTDSCRSLVLIGDPCQLPPTVKTDHHDESLLSLPLMTRLSSTLPAPVIVTAQTDKMPCDESFLSCKATRTAQAAVSREGGTQTSYRKQFAGALLLSVQYRMSPSIAAFSSAIFYDTLLKSPTILSNIRRFPKPLDDAFPIGASGRRGAGVRFVNVGGCDKEQRGLRTIYDTPKTNEKRSYSNAAEAEQVMKTLEILNKDSSFNEQEQTIGIVSPYSSQVILLKKLLEDSSLTDEFKELVEINSVDGYQGRERDVIILSTVRSNRKHNVGFLSDWRRMNVAITRAKSGLIVVGDVDTLVNGDVHWRAFIDWCSSIGCVSTPI